MSRKPNWFLCLVVILVLPTGCSEENGVPPSGPNSDLVSVTGNVTRIVDDIPVDGNVTIDLELGDGTTETLYLPSFFMQPLTEEQEQVYQVIKQLKIGSRVKGEGERTKLGVKLSSLAIL